MNYHRLVLLAAIAVEVTGTSALKLAADMPVAGYIASMGLLSLSLFLLSVALRAIPMVAAYALWEGLGIVGLAAIGYFVFGEALGPLRVLGLSAILVGIWLLLRGTNARAA